MEQKEDLDQKIISLMQFSQALGVLKHVNEFNFTNFKLTFNPFLSTREFHKNLGSISQLWQEILFRISQDPHFVLTLFEPLIEKDQMVRRLLQIFRKKGGKADQRGITFARSDYYIDLSGQPKVTEYNLMSVGMQSNMEQFQEAKRLSDYSHKDQYPESATINCFARTVREFYDKNNLSGLFIMAISGYEPNFFDQKRLEIELIKQGIKTKRATFPMMLQNIRIDENNNLFYGSEPVSVVYYRVGYRLDQFVINGDAEACWKMKETIELSNAISLPPVVMELVNEKRMQAELTKPDVLRRYASEEEAKIIESTLVKEWQFDTIGEESYSKLLQQIKQNPGAYILKPNMQGGGNNHYGEKAYEKLLSISPEQRRSFILMEKINSPATECILMSDAKYHHIKCVHEISRYGAFSWIDGKLLRNEIAGFLIRAKPENENEGGIMSGVGSIVPWKFSN